MKVGPSKKDAQIRERQLFAQVASGQFSDPRLRDVKISVITKAYLDERMKFRKSYKSALSYCKRIDEYLGTASLKAFDENPGILVRFFQNFPDESFSPKSIWNFRLTLKAAINHWIKMRRLHMKNPVDIVELDPGTNVREYVPSEDEYIHLLNTASEMGLPEYIQWLFIAVWESGLRIGEVLLWKWENIDLDPKDGYPSLRITITKQKRQTIRTVPMSRNLWEMLKAIPGQHEHGPVFPVQSPPHRLLTRHQLMAKAGLGHLRPFHDFRKSWKTRMKAKGYSSEKTKAFQGHATDSMDQYYTIFQKADLEDMVRDTWEG